ncbi:MAG: DUF1211 domain-containing protein [Alphaproteobacteria bacterium]|nr:DUF1211 domain-containing protein [Alphaproteobacteria bacterium]
MEQVRRELSPVRLEAFSDGVIAIIITIMVLELRLPAYAAEQGLLHGLFLPMAPKFATYAMSFLLVAIMWVNHNAVIGTVHDCTRAIFWQNNYLLFWMSLIPLSTAFLGDHPRLPDAYAVYGFVLAAACSGFAGLRWLASRQGRGDAALAQVHRTVMRRSILATSLYAASVPLAYVSIYAAIVIFIAVPVMFFLPIFAPRATAAAD